MSAASKKPGKKHDRRNSTASNQSSVQTPRQTALATAVHNQVRCTCGASPDADTDSGTARPRMSHHVRNPSNLQHLKAGQRSQEATAGRQIDPSVRVTVGGRDIFPVDISPRSNVKAAKKTSIQESRARSQLTGAAYSPPQVTVPSFQQYLSATLVAC